MQFYTIKDLKERLNLYPCSDEKNYIHYNEGTLIEKVRKDFNGKKNFNERKCWNNEKPQIYGICGGLNENGTKKFIPYPKEAENFVKTVKTHSGGRNTIIMNKSYFDNCYYAIEKEYWEKKSDVYKRDTRAKIRDAISISVETGNANELRQMIEQILNDFLIRSNKKIASINDFLECKYSQFDSYLNFYQSSYVQRYVEKPVILLLRMNMQMDTMQDGIKPLLYSNRDKFVDNAVKLISDNYYSNTEKINILVDRIYSQERELIKQLKEIYNDFENTKAEINELENDIKKKTGESIKANKKILPGSLIIDHAKNNGLLSASFRLS